MSGVIGQSRATSLTWMRLRYFKPYPWLNRFTAGRRGACGPEVRETRPLLVSLHLARIGARVVP